MTNNKEVKALWEASGRKARVQYYGATTSRWHTYEVNPLFMDTMLYRIHPDDIHLCQPDTRTDITTPDPYAYAKSIMDAAAAGKKIEMATSIPSHWKEISPPIGCFLLEQLNDPAKFRIAPEPPQSNAVEEPLRWLLRYIRDLAKEAPSEEAKFAYIRCISAVETLLDESKYKQ